MLFPYVVRLSRRQTLIDTQIHRFQAFSRLDRSGTAGIPVRGGLSKNWFHSSTAEDVSKINTPRDAFIESRNVFAPLDTFARRHIGPSIEDTQDMLKSLKPPVKSLDDFVKQVVPESILSKKDLKIDHAGQGKVDGLSESQLLTRLKELASQNKVVKTYIGCGYANTIVPEVIKRNILENPAWYTSYTPYQPEISQGRLESLLNFQTMVSDLTGLAISNASVLDEATAAAEAMTMSLNTLPTSRQKRKNKTFLVSHLCHPQSIAVLESRAQGFGIKIEVADVLEHSNKRVKELGDDLVGVLVQYPDTQGAVLDFKSLAEDVHGLKSTLCVATDLLALTILTPPGEFGADIAFGNAQRFGVPFGFGGPHAAFFACSEKYKRKIPGRLIGLSKDRLGDKAARLALQTREQHIRREKATSNICTAQALLANMSAMYAVYHGPQGLKKIALRTIMCARVIEEIASRLGYETSRDMYMERSFFDTIMIKKDGGMLLNKNTDINVRKIDQNTISLTFDETTTEDDLDHIVALLKSDAPAHKSSSISKISITDTINKIGDTDEKQLQHLPKSLIRNSKYLQHPVFNTHHSETEILRYMHHLQSKDLSLVHSMIPLGSCTMKLNATTEMVPVTWPEFANIHPFAPEDQTKGYRTMIKELEDDLAVITGFAAVSLQPNSGAQGEFAGLRVIRKFHEDQSLKKRDICLIPVSAHGTNPASAAMAGMRVVPLKCDTETGNLDMNDLEEKCKHHSEELAAIMITYPSTFGVFEPEVKKACDLVHKHGGQVYMDGANMNAQIGLCSPGEIGADVCHLNLHKTFCIPHGGGGPGVGPIGVASHLAPYLPGHPLVSSLAGPKASAPISAAPWGSASILPISW